MSLKKWKPRKYILLGKSLAVESSVTKIYLIFSLFLVTGYGDVTFNPRRNFLGAMCAGGEIAYHLYKFDISKSDDIVKLIRKSRWHSQYSTKKRNLIINFPQRTHFNELAFRKLHS